PPAPPPLHDSLPIFTTSVRISPVAPQSDVTGFLVDTAVRGWRLQHATVDTATCNSMVAFHEAQKGPWLAFQFRNPNDGQLYTARFASDFSPTLFRPGLL